MDDTVRNTLALTVAKCRPLSNVDADMQTSQQNNSVGAVPRYDSRISTRVSDTRSTRAASRAASVELVVDSIGELSDAFPVLKPQPKPKPKPKPTPTPEEREL